MARCIREKEIELSPKGRAALDALAHDFSTWRANPTWRGTPLLSKAPTPVAVGPTGSWSPSRGRGHPAPVSDAVSPLRSERAGQVVVEAGGKAMVAGSLKGRRQAGG